MTAPQFKDDFHSIEGFLFVHRHNIPCNCRRWVSCGRRCSLRPDIDIWPGNTQHNSCCHKGIRRSGGIRTDSRGGQNRNSDIVRRDQDHNSALRKCSRFRCCCRIRLRRPAKLSEVMTPKAKKIAVINLIMVKFPNYCVCSEFSTAEVSFW